MKKRRIGRKRRKKMGRIRRRKGKEEKEMKNIKINNNKI